MEQFVKSHAHSLGVFNLVLGLVLIISMPAFAEPQQPLTELDDYLQFAFMNHPSLDGARALAEAAEYSADQAGALPDLKLAWGEMIVPVETRVGPQQRVLSISQSLPWFGSLGASESQADMRAEAALKGFDVRQWQVRQQVARSWIELARLLEAERLLEAHVRLSEQSEEVALRSYESGTAPLRHVLQAQMSVDRLEVEFSSLLDHRQTLTVALNKAAALPFDTATPAAKLPALPDIPLTTLQAEELLLNQNPILQALRLDEESHRFGVEAARLAGRPGFTVGLDYIMTGEAAMSGVQDSGKDPMIARLAVNVPLWSGKATARRLASASRLQAASSERQRQLLQLQNSLEKSLFRLRDARRRQQLHDEKLLPQARQIHQAALKDYEAGRASFDEVIRARETLLDLETAQLGSRAEQALALIDLETLLATPHEAWSFTESGQ